MATKQRLDALDSTNLQLLEELQSNSRLSNAELGRRVGLSAPAVADRLARLEEGAIVAYRAEIDPRALGFLLSVVLRIRPAPRELLGAQRRAPRGSDRPFRSLWPDDHLDRAVVAGPAARPAVTTGGLNAQGTSRRNRR